MCKKAHILCIIYDTRNIRLQFNRSDLGRARAAFNPPAMMFRMNFHTFDSIRLDLCICFVLSLTHTHGSTRAVCSLPPHRGLPSNLYSFNLVWCVTNGHFFLEFDFHPKFQHSAVSRSYNSSPRHSRTIYGYYMLRCFMGAFCAEQFIPV